MCHYRESGKREKRTERGKGEEEERAGRKKEEWKEEGSQRGKKIQKVLLVIQAFTFIYERRSI